MWRLFDQMSKRFKYPPDYGWHRDFFSDERVRLFMDDHVIFFKTIEEAILLILPITSIFRNHGMDIGAKKTNIMLRHNAQNLSKFYEYDFIDEYKYLGTPISNDLLWVTEREREFLD